jgi:serine-type D-Ala-D-Ala endopeptidase (penicillin-binding protein 7)
MIHRILLFLAICLVATGTYAASAKPDAPKSSLKAKAKSVVKAKTPHKKTRRASKRTQKRKYTRIRATPKPAPSKPGVLDVRSTTAIVVDQLDGSVLYAKNAAAVSAIASITKLMTAMVVLDAKQSLDEAIAVTEDDIDHLKNTTSRIQIGNVLTRGEMLRLALMSSENRAASALARAYPGGVQAFIRDMNLKAIILEMKRSSFVDGTGLSSGNVSSAEDLANMVLAAHHYPLIRQYSTGSEYTVPSLSGRIINFRNTNHLISSPAWQIGLSKTGYIREAGRCLVMQATVADRPVVIVLLDARGTQGRFGDANRIRRWMEYHAAVDVTS